MAKDHSFDITFEISLMEVDNALNQTVKEIANRYDFKGVETTLERKDKELLMETGDDYKVESVKEMFHQKLAKRGVNIKAIKWEENEKAGGDRVRTKAAIQSGIPQEKAKEIVKTIKGMGLKKIQPSIQDEKVRITSPDIDTLQTAIEALKTTDFGIAVQFTNYR